jgi:hypothetical protein
MAVSGKKVATSAATGAALGTAVYPGIGTAVGAVGGALYGLFSGDGSSGAQQAPPAQYAAGNGSDLTNHLAALDYSEGLTQQQAQNAREAGFYSQAGGNFDIANAAQTREAPQIQGSAIDQQRQLAALNQTNQAGGQLTGTGNLLTDLGTRPMGDSYAEAQLRQGQQAAMAQQLSMARSGRSLGSGQAAMNAAAFNNAALNQQTNQAAASARIQEQNAYNQFQANTLGQAGSQYGAAGNLAGQAGNQATTIRTGNEGLQAQNAALQQGQQGINNQTTGLYNSLGAQQEGLGMQANQQGQNAYQFGAQQGSNKQIAQLNANVGQTSSTTATNLANAAADRNTDAAKVNLATTALAQGAEAIDGATNGGSSGSASPTDPNAAFKNITTASHVTPTGGPTPPTSDEKNKTGIVPLDQLVRPGLGLPSAAAPATSSGPPKKGEPGYADYMNAQAKQAIYDKPGGAAVKAADEKAAADAKAGIVPTGPLMDDQDLGKVAVRDEPAPGPDVASYGQTIAALNDAYRPSQFAPADILNHVPGAGSGHSASQDAVIAAMQKKPRLAATDTGRSAIPINASAPPSLSQLGGTRQAAPLDVGSMVRGLSPTAAPAAASSSADAWAKDLSGRPTPVQAPPPAPPPAWGDVFNAPKLWDPVSRYLQGYDPYVAPPPTPAPAAAAPVARNPAQATQYRGSENVLTLPTPMSPQANQYRGSENTTANDHTSNNRSGIETKKNIVPIGSDNRSKSRIRELEGQLDALGAGGPPRDGETTRLSAAQQAGFPAWLRANGVRDLDNPDSHYDYRGAYLGGVGRGADSGHFPDTYKQHGHPTFSVESQYSGNANDGGTWEGERFSPAVQPRAPDYAALDDAYARQQRPEGVDFRNAHGYTYEYKDPDQPGAAHGLQVGTMAQELERTDAAPYVHDSPGGKTVDTSRLPLALAPAIGHTQRRVDDLERELSALKGSGFGAYQPGLYPSPRSPY